MLIIGPVAAAILGPAIGAGISTIGGYFTGRSQQKFAERMSSTAHQREVRDLMMSGLNPILSVNRGASTPSPNIPHIGKSAGSAGIATGQLRLQQALNKAQIGLLEKQTDKTEQERIGVELDNIKKSVIREPYDWLKSVIESVKDPEQRRKAVDWMQSIGGLGETGFPWTMPSDRRKGPGAWKHDYTPQNRRKAGELLRQHRRRKEK